MRVYTLMCCVYCLLKSVCLSVNLSILFCSVYTNSEVMGMGISTILFCFIADEEMFPPEQRFAENGLRATWQKTVQSASSDGKVSPHVIQVTCMNKIWTAVYNFFIDVLSLCNIYYCHQIVVLTCTIKWIPIQSL